MPLSTGKQNLLSKVDKDNIGEAHFLR